MSEERLHRYAVVAVGQDVTAVKVGDVLIYPWHGRRHDFYLEKNGQVSYFCTGVHIEPLADSLDLGVEA